MTFKPTITLRVGQFYVINVMVMHYQVTVAGGCHCITYILGQFVVLLHVIWCTGQKLAAKLSSINALTDLVIGSYNMIIA